jgi:predicted ester cyclase
MGADSDVVRRLTNEVFVDGDFSHWDDLIDDSFVDHDPMPGMPNDKKGQRQTAEAVVAGFSNRKAETDEMIETTDGRVVENWVFGARHTGEMMGMPPSGKDVRIRGIEIWRCANGKIVEHWGVVDISDVLEKAGLVPG